SDIWIAVFDSAGSKIGDFDYGGNDADIPVDIEIVNDEIWITGWSDSPLSGNKTTNNCGQTADGWIIRLAKKFYINNKTLNALCKSKNSMKVHFTTTIDFNPGNIFTVQLSDANGNFSFPINIGGLTGIKTDSILVTLPPGTPVSPNYKLRIIASLPADTTTFYPFWLYGSPVVNLGNDTLICQNTNLTLSAGAQPLTSQLIWNTGGNSNSITVATPGIYWCEVQTGCGNIRDSIQVQVKFIPITDTGPDTSFCRGKTILLQSNPQFPDASYIWSTGATADSISIQNAGIYWLKVSNTCGTSTDSILTTTLPLPTINIDKSNFLCAGSSRVLDAGAGYSNYLWNNEATTPTIIINNIGTYSVIVTDNYGCTATDTTHITKMILLPAKFLLPDTSICSYEDILLKSKSNFSNYLWSTGSVSNSILVKQPAPYWLEVKDNYGCIGKDTILIKEKECPTGFYMPTGFTPNNDGKNDLCRPILFGNIVQYHFTLYNRWGEKIFESRNRFDGWDGKIRGVPSNSEVFIWICNYLVEGGKEKFEKGTVVLIR
ncbi:MAG TPA: gliding motility-associated C-terminal domain-containing protein, partial [Chitinophagaceae bacterium]|nr:gliding motility-associated C-terminal domain-containing protein [Chitinophagaceae bacterium]